MEVGDRVSLTLMSRELSGQIAFRGQTHFASGEWVGVVLEEAEGKNDGVVAGVRYFGCKPNHGLFVRPARLTSVNSGQSDVPPRQRPAPTGPPQVGWTMLCCSP